MFTFGIGPVRPGDVPVCFPGRPCLDYSPLTGGVINVTSALTPASFAIGVGVFALLAGALLGLGLHGRRFGLTAWPIVVTTALVVSGTAIRSVVRVRFSAILEIYGREGPGGPELFGSWWLVGMAGAAMAMIGLLVLVTTAAVAVHRANATNRMLEVHARPIPRDDPN